MPGVEIVGIVLGAFPILLAGLNKTRRKLRNRKSAITTLTQKLQTQQGVFENNCRILLNGLVAPDRIEQVMSDPDGWREPLVERKIKQRLGSDYSYFIEAMQVINECIRDLGSRLKIDTRNKIDLDRNLKDKIQNLMMSFNVEPHNASIAEIEKGNEILFRIIQQLQHLPGWKISSRTSPDFKSVRTIAKRIYSSMRSGYKCSCDHIFGLRMEVQFDGSHGAERDERPHRLAISTIPVDSLGGIHVALQEIELRFLKAPPTSNINCHNRTNERHRTPGRMMHLNGSSLGKGVRFVADATNLGRNPHVLIEGLEVDLDPIDDLCVSLRGVDCRPVPSYIGYLETTEATERINIFIPDIEVQQSGAFISFADVLQDAAHFNESFTPVARMSAAVVLASNLLRLYSTPWLMDSWSEKDVFFKRSTGGVDFDHLFIARKGLKDSIPSFQGNNNVSCLIRHRALFSLGVMMIELWRLEPFGVHLNGSGSEHDLYSDESFKRASALVDSLYYTAGSGYAEVAQRCVRGEFSFPPREFDLNNERFLQAVYKNVVVLLETSSRFFISGLEGLNRG